MPGKRPVGACLTVVIDQHGAVRVTAAKIIARVRISRIATGAGINEIGLAESAALNAEQICMTMTTADVTTQRAGIKNQMMRAPFPATALHYIATFTKALHCC